MSRKISACIENHARNFRTWALLVVVTLVLAGTEVAWGENYTITDLHLGGTVAFGYNVNDSGHVTGVGTNASGQLHTFFYKDGVLTVYQSISGRPQDTNFSVGMNKFDQIVGASAVNSLDYMGTIWTNGVPASLGTLPGSATPFLSYGYGINDAGEVVGYGTSNMPNNHAFHWKSGVMTALITLGGTESMAYAINNKGQIVGEASEANAREIPGIPGLQVKKPVLWENGNITCLCNDVESMEGGAAYAANENGQIVGHCKNWDASNLEHREAVVWQNGQMLEIGALGGADGDGWGNNEAGQVVGWAETATGAHHAFLWQDGTMVDLNSLIPANSGWVLDTAFDINNHGQIVGYGSFAGKQHAFILNPAPRARPKGDCNGDLKSDLIFRHPSSGAVNLWLME